MNGLIYNTYVRVKIFIIDYYKLLLYIKIILFQCLCVGVCVSECGLVFVSTVETLFAITFSKKNKIYMHNESAISNNVFFTEKILC